MHDLRLRVRPALGHVPLCADLVLILSQMEVYLDSRHVLILALERHLRAPFLEHGDINIGRGVKIASRHRSKNDDSDDLRGAILRGERPCDGDGPLQKCRVRRLDVELAGHRDPPASRPGCKWILPRDRCAPSLRRTRVWWALESGRLSYNSSIPRWSEACYISRKRYSRPDSKDSCTSTLARARSSCRCSSRL